MSNFRKTTVLVLAVALGIFAFHTDARAQQGAIAGQVTDANTAEPVAGATVRVEGTDIGAVTSPDGSYRVTGVGPGTVTLVVRRLGYRRAERTVDVSEGETIRVDIALEVSRVQLGEVVAAVQAAEVERRAVGTDVSRIDASQEVDKGSVENFTDIINARASNVEISAGGGQVGAGAQIRVRGSTSITQDNFPLIVVDGVRASNNVPNLAQVGEIDFGGQTTSRFEDLNPHDIASIQVVKGPTAATLYGSEAAAGVIVVETKQGQQDEQPRVRFRTRQGWTVDNAEYPDNFADLTTFFGVTDPDDPRLDGFRTAQNPVTGTVFAIDNPLMDPDTRPFRKGYNRSYGAQLTGGGETVGYFGSAEYQQLEGTLPTNQNERVRARANFGVEVSDYVDVSLSSAYFHQNLDLISTASLQGWMPLGFLGQPTLSFGDKPAPGEGPCLLTVLGGPEGACDGRNGVFFAQPEDLAKVQEGEDLDRFMGSGSVNIEPPQPFDWLTVRATGGIDAVNRRFLDLVPFDSGPLRVQSGVTDARDNITTITADFGATAEFDLPSGFTSTTSAGVQGFFKEFQRAACIGDQFSAAGITSCDGAAVSRGQSDRIENNELGAYGQHRVGWNGWIYATGAVRIDDNSALGAEADVLVSPNVNTSIVLSEAPFWNVGLVDDLRVRAAWGQASQAPDQFAGDLRFGNTVTTIGGTQRQGLTRQQPGNPELTAEESEEFEVGVDFELLDGRIGGSFTYYDQETSDAIVPVPVAPSEGFPQDRFLNLARVTNKGIEASLDARVLNDAFGFLDWDVRVSASTKDPIVAELGRAPIQFPTADVATTAAGFSQVFAEGFAPGAYISRVVADASRNEDGEITSFTLAPPNVPGTQKRVVGSPIVTNEQSLSTTFQLFDRIRVFALFDRDGGNDLLWALGAFRGPFIPPQASPNSSFSRRFAFRQAEETPETQAEIENQFINPFVHDGSFVRWRELTIRYDLPQVATEIVGLQNASLTVGGRNLYVFTDFPGQDPEGNITGAADSFVRNNAFEQAVPNSFFAELNITF